MSDSSLPSAPGGAHFPLTVTTGSAGEPPARPGTGVGAQYTRADLLARVAMLEGKLATLPAIEQAKGALMLTYGISADAAFALLRFHSQDRNVKIRAIADQLTTLMSSSSNSREAIARFDWLLDEVTDRLRLAGAATARAGTAQLDISPAGSGSWPDLDAGQLPDVMLRAVATAPPGITIAGNDPDRPLLYANDAFTTMTGYRINDVMGRNCRFLQGPDTNRDEVARISNALRDGREISVVLRNYRSDGTPFWNEVSISPVRSRSEEITHYVGTQIDITRYIDQQDPEVNS